MGWTLFIFKKDGTKQLLRSDSQWRLRQERSKISKSLKVPALYISPPIKDGKAFHFPILINSKKRLNV